MKDYLYSRRIWEIDFLRGIAIIFMVYFHALYDMEYIFNYDVVLYTPINSLIIKFGAALFIFISGISANFSKSNFKRGLKVLAAALAISAITHLFDYEQGIKFGILHFFAVCMLASPWLLKQRNVILGLISVLAFALSFVVSNANVNFDWLFPFGIVSDNFISSDYYPLIPWAAFYCLGIVFARFFYKDRRSLLPKGHTLPDNIVNIAGRNSLWIYLLHQPVIMGILYLLQKL